MTFGELSIVKFPKAVIPPITPSKTKLPGPTAKMRLPGPSNVETNVTLPTAPPVTLIVNVPATTVVGSGKTSAAPGAMISPSMIVDPLTSIVRA